MKLSRRWLVLGLALVFANQAVIAKLTLSQVTAVNVTPSSFSIVGECSSAIDTNTTVSVAVFADAGGVTNLAGQLGLEVYPLRTGSPGSTNDYARRLNQAALRQSSMRLGLVYQRASGCSPGTTYYYQVQVSQTNGQHAVWPTNGPLPAVTTPLENAFVVDSEQLVITLGEASPGGAVILLANTNTPTILAAVVGDGAATNQAFFSINELLAAAGDTNTLPGGTQEFTASVVGPPSLIGNQSYSLDFSTNFVVGGAAQVNLGGFVALALGSNVVLAGQGGSIPIRLQAATFLTNFSFTLIVPTNRFSSLSLQPLVAQLGTASLTPAGTNALQAVFAAAPGQTFQGDQQVAQLNFVTASNQSSAFVALVPQNLAGTNTDASAVSRTAAQAGRVVVVGPQSLLEALRAPAGARNLALYGHPGASYQVQVATNLSKAGAWMDAMRVPLTNTMEVFSMDKTPPAAFYRAYEFTAADPIMDIGPPVNGTLTLVIYGTPWMAYELDAVTSLSFPLNWKPLARFPFTNSFQILKINPTGSALFYRTTPLSPDPPVLEAHLDSHGRSVLVYGRAGTNYVLQSSTNASSASIWSPVLSYTLTNSFQVFTNLGNAQPLILYRIKRP